MRLNKLSHKSINSWLLFAALFAPVLYLFGALFTTQLGSHGERNLYDYVYVEGYSQVDSFVAGNGSVYKIVVNDNVAPLMDSLSTSNGYSFDFDFYSSTFDATCRYVNFFVNSTDSYIYVLPTNGNGVDIVKYNFSSGSINYYYPLPWSFISDSFPQTFIDLLLPYSDLYILTDVPTDTQNQSFSDYLFGQFFTRDNFLAKSGKNVIEGTENYGFQPMGELIRFTDANMLHLSNLEYGHLMIGYAYYAIHVIFLDLIVYLTLFIPRLIRMLVERLEGGVDL